MRGVTQPIPMSRMTLTRCLLRYAFHVGEACHVETNEEVPPPLLSLPRIFIARVSTKGNDLPGGSILILILIRIRIL